jgi:putative phosphoesterase
LKIGLIADIHANLPALDQVLAALARQAVDVVLCAGDLLCYGAQPNETLWNLRNLSIACVVGNYDQALAYDLPRASRKSSSPANDEIKQAALEWARSQLDPQHKRYLRGLPWIWQAKLDGLAVAMMHASLDTLDEALGPETPAALLELEDRLAADVIVLGHTHHPYTYRGRSALFINPGAVGRALDGDVRASYAIIETMNCEVRLERVAYNLAETVDSIEASGMPRMIGELLRRGARSPDEVTRS